MKDDKIYYLGIKLFFHDVKTTTSFQAKDIITVDSAIVNCKKDLFQKVKSQSRMISKRFRIGVEFMYGIYTSGEHYVALDNMLHLITEDYVTKNALKMNTNFLCLDWELIESG